jgi:hypothetical protein
MRAVIGKAPNLACKRPYRANGARWQRGARVVPFKLQKRLVAPSSAMGRPVGTGAGDAEVKMPGTPTRSDRPVEERGANAHTEAAVGQILEFDALLPPDLFDRALGCAPRLGVALLSVDRPRTQKWCPALARNTYRRQFVARTLRALSAWYRRIAAARPYGPSGHNAADLKAARGHRTPRDSTELGAAAFEPTRLALGASAN